MFFGLFTSVFSVLRFATLCVYVGRLAHRTVEGLFLEVSSCDLTHRNTSRTSSSSCGIFLLLTAQFNTAMYATAATYLAPSYCWHTGTRCLMDSFRTSFPLLEASRLAPYHGITRVSNYLSTCRGSWS
ncbi:hypothetical protein C8R47DRAFT_143890 [Mycena vitilis]|nr:hypothetical protein C8R47DRAFT_143890 [Mycena vitilis]